MSETCFGLNGHPRARMDTILRQFEAEVKIFKSRWFPAPTYRSKWSNIASQGWNMKKSSKKSIFWNLFLDFSIDPGGPGGNPGGSRTHPGAEKHQKNEKIEKELKIGLFILSPGAELYRKNRKKNPKKTFVCMCSQMGKNEKWWVFYVCMYVWSKIHH